MKVRSYTVTKKHKHFPINMMRHGYRFALRHLPALCIIKETVVCTSMCICLSEYTCRFPLI